jgi:hypothetical protein
MKARITVCSLALLAALSFAVGAQTQRGISPGAIPIEQEPQHKVAFKNDFVRIIDATLPPGYVTKDHIHLADSVSVNVANGREGEEALRGLGRAGFSRGGYSHVVTNSNKAIVRYIVVEPIKGDRPGAAAAMTATHTLESENDRVRIYRVRLAAGESLQAHSHPAGYVEVTVAGSQGPGAFAWVPAGELRPLKAPAGGPMEAVEVEPK